MKTPLVAQALAIFCLLHEVRAVAPSKVLLMSATAATSHFCNPAPSNLAALRKVSPI